MKQYSVEYDPHVLKKLTKMDAPVRRRITKWIDENLSGCENPRAHGKVLHGDLKDYWSYRVGGYRIIAKIDKRGEVYS